MNAYFFKMDKAERNNILDQHKKVYDGYVTDYGQQINQQPLYIQDLANDKLGLTVNNKGEVKHYTNVRINEMRYDGKDVGLFSNEDDYEDDTEFDIDNIEDEIFEDMAEPLEEQVNKVLDMFKRFKKYGNN